MKLSDYAKMFGVTYRTAWNRYKNGKINNAFIDSTGHVLIPFPISEKKHKDAVIYSRVSSNDAKDNLKRQSERLQEFAIKNGYIIKKNVMEIGSGMNDERKKLIEILKDCDFDVLIVENKDRLTRYGFNYIKTLIESKKKEIIVVNNEEDSENNLIKDMISIVYSFSARLYGNRRSKEKAKSIFSKITEQTK